MSTIYRKSLKGIDEVAFKSAGLPLRLVSYLLVVDGEASADQLAARNAHLPSMSVVLKGLQEQGFLEMVGEGSSANVVDMVSMRVGNGSTMFNPAAAPAAYSAPPAAYSPQPPAYSPQPAPAQNFAAAPSFSPELEGIKANMIRDISALLGADAAPVMQKIQGCRTKDDLFATMMGIKKIVMMYTDRASADKFAARYSALAG